MNSSVVTTAPAQLETPLLAVAVGTGGGINAPPATLHVSVL